MLNDWSRWYGNISTLSGPRRCVARLVKRLAPLELNNTSKYGCGCRRSDVLQLFYLVFHFCHFNPSLISISLGFANRLHWFFKRPLALAHTLARVGAREACPALWVRSIAPPGHFRPTRLARQWLMNWDLSLRKNWSCRDRQRSSFNRRVSHIV